MEGRREGREGRRKATNDPEKDKDGIRHIKRVLFGCELYIYVHDNIGPENFLSCMIKSGIIIQDFLLAFYLYVVGDSVVNDIVAIHLPPQKSYRLIR